MSRSWIAAALISGTLVIVPVFLNAQSVPKGTLAKAKRIRCTFSVKVVGTWGATQPEAKVSAVNELLEFESINADEGTAKLKGTSGDFDIVVRYAEGYLHFIQSFLNGPLHVTTVLEKKTADGKLKAMNSRHEFTDFALPGFTSSPEQYYGECEVIE